MHSDCGAGGEGTRGSCRMSPLRNSNVDCHLVDVRPGA